MMSSARSGLTWLLLLAAAPAGFGQTTVAPGTAGWTTTPIVPVDDGRVEATGPVLPRWFCTVEAASVWAWFGDLMSPSQTSGLRRDLGSCVAPQAAFGVRLDSGAALLVNYRYLSTSVKPEDADNGDLPWHSNLTGHWLDGDYQSAPAAFGPWNVQWQGGLRVAHLAYDLRHAQSSPWGSNETALMTDFWGAGPHIALLSRLPLGGTGLSMFGLADLGFEIGGASYTTEDKNVWTPPPGFGQPVTYRHSETVRELLVMADVRTELGFSYTNSFTGLRLDSGYRFAASAWGSLIFSDHGPFVRLGLGF
ncbi:MAG: hypothetical protein JNM56_07895 [Planctomycetia bacterium]|nr:hypothetical protein [Planctomycetia bacterium]